ncbi:MAG: methyltransferase domain-containing protein, partial [Acidimicrobiales bacterium]
MVGGNGFDGGYRRRRASAAHASLLGEGLPPEVEPFSFVPMEGLELLARLAAIGTGQTLVDLGCGRGGPGMWLAKRIG